MKEPTNSQTTSIDHKLSKRGRELINSRSESLRSGPATQSVGRASPASNKMSQSANSHPKNDSPHIWILFSAHYYLYMNVIFSGLRPDFKIDRVYK